MAQEPLIRVRLGVRDARTETGQIDPARLMELFNDAAANLVIAYRRDEGLLRAYQNVELVAPLRIGDYIEVRGRVIDVARKALTIELVAHVVARAAHSVESPLGGTLVEPPRLVARATGVWLAPEAAARDQADETAEEERGVEPLSWGGHRPKDRPPAKRRPGPDVHMRSDDEVAARPPGGNRPRSGQGSDRPYGGDRPRGGQGGGRSYGGGQGGGSRSYGGDRPRSGQGGGGDYGDRPRGGQGGGSRSYGGDRDRRGQGGGSRSYDRDRERGGQGGGSRPPYRQDDSDKPPQGGEGGSDKPQGGEE